MKTRKLLIMVIMIALVSACGSDDDSAVEGPPGEDGSSCTVDEVDGSAVISCDDGTQVTIDGTAQDSCEIEQSGGDTTLRCGDEEVGIV